MLENGKYPTTLQAGYSMGSYTYLSYVNIQLKLLTWFQVLLLLKRIPFHDVVALHLKLTRNATDGIARTHVIENGANDGALV